MKIRLATMEDIPAISRLVYSLSAKYIASQFSEKGARNLLRSMELPAVEGYLKSGYRYHLAEDDGVLVGVVSTRDNMHLYHLFVAESHQRRGLAQELWRVAREACIAAGNPGEFTVNSSWRRTRSRVARRSSGAVGRTAARSTRAERVHEE